MSKSIFTYKLYIGDGDGEREREREREIIHGKKLIIIPSGNQTLLAGKSISNSSMIFPAN